MLTHDRPEVEAWEAITLQADPTYQLSVEDMLTRLGDFKPPARRGNSLGVHKAAMWLHIPIVAREAPRTPWVKTALKRAKAPAPCAYGAASAYPTPPARAPTNSFAM